MTSPRVTCDNDLPGRWRNRDRFTILEVGFGVGPEFLVAWSAWQRDPCRSDRLSWVAIGDPAASRRALAGPHVGETSTSLAAEVLAAWPVATHDLHRIVFDAGRVELLLAFGDAGAWLREIDVSADAFFLESLASVGDPRACRVLGRLAAPGATLTVRAAANAVREHLAGAGFEVCSGTGRGADPAITRAHFRPVHTPRPAARRVVAGGRERRAIIVGGGLAGSAVAAALAERGWRSTVVERHATLAAEASGNAAGLFHGTVHGDDGVHARFARAGALAVVPVVESARRTLGIAGSTSGVLRLETRLDFPAMAALLARSGLPAEHVVAVDAATASALAGLPLSGPAWHYPRGGWVDPSALVRACAARAGGDLEVRTGVDVAAIRSSNARWQIVDAVGGVIDAADTLVLANAGDALRLIGSPDWPVERVRGQISMLPHGAAPALLAPCRMPVAGSGYLIPTPAGAWFGATRERNDDDDDGSVRLSDHASNVARLEALVGAPLSIDLDALGGRTAWRCETRDRLPIIGAVPALAVLHGPDAREPLWDQPRHVPREPGLFMLCALGSRGITGSAIGAQVLAAQISGGTVPLASRLIDAIDPARFVSRQVRRAASAGPTRREKIA